MSIQGKIQAQPRSVLGKRECRRLREQGLIPGNLYGHKEAPTTVTVPVDDMAQILKLGTKVLEVNLAGKTSTALVREVQWDYLGANLQHVDLLRVDPNERFVVEVHVELKGVAPGVLSGGVLDHSLRTLSVECPVSQIPDNIQVRMTALEVGHAIHVRELDVPEGVKVLNNPDAVVVRIAKAVEEALPLAGAEGPVQPEVIGRKAEAEEEAE